MDDKTKELYKKAWSRWKDLQYFMLFEEMGELQQAVSKYIRGRGTKENIIEELADVEVIIEQFKVIFGEEEVAKVKLEKIARLQKLMDDYEAGQNIPEDKVKQIEAFL